MENVRHRLSAFTSILVIFTICFCCGYVQAAKKTDPSVEVLHLVHYDVSPPLRDIPPAPRKAGVQRAYPVKPLPRPWPEDLPVQQNIDGALQSSAIPSPDAPGVSVQFNGIGSNNGYTVNSAPPDTNGDVSSQYYVQIVNTDFAVFNKTTGAYVLGPLPNNTIWSGFGGGCQSNNDGDPTITYDQVANRWVLTQFSVSTTPFLECIAVSQTGDPTGSWFRYSYSFTNFPDYPKVGLMVDASNPGGGAYYITYNMFNGNTFAGGQVCAYNRSAMLTGAAATAAPCFNVGTSFGGLLAADLDGSTLAPSGSSEFVVTMGNDNASLVYWTVVPSFSGSGSMTHTGPTTLPVASFTPACNGGTCVPQSGVTQQLDSLADRLMNRLQYRNFAGTIKMVVSHAVSTSGTTGPAGSRWYQLNVSGSSLSVAQQGTFSPNTTYRWMPSIAMDQSADIAMGYSTSSSSLHPGVAFTGRIPTDAANTMQSETVAFTGAGSQTGSSLSRWGDYSNMSVDPADDCTFWFTTEYIPSNGAFNWATRIVSFKFPTCGGGGGDTTPPTTSITSPSNGATVSGTITISATASDNVGVTNVEFYRGTTLIGSDSSSPYSVSWDTTTVGNGSYSLTSKAYDAAGNNGTSAAVNVTVNNVGGPPALMASYSTTFRAPACGSGGKSCDTGATIINGRDTMSGGNEPNQPNTINNSCSDGTSGTYHSDESIDAMLIATNDGTAFAGGKAVTVSVTVWCWGHSR